MSDWPWWAWALLVWGVLMLWAGATGSRNERGQAWAVGVMFVLPLIMLLFWGWSDAIPAIIDLARNNW